MENLLPKGMLSTPRRTLIAGGVAVVLAVILLFVYLSHYRSSVKSESANVPVLRAKDFIAQGTSADTLAKKGMFEVAAIPKDSLQNGAVTDPAAIHGQVALTDIYPGQQLTATDFGITATTSALSGSADLLGVGRRAGTWRALAVALDGTHGIVPQIQSDDRVDAYAQIGGILGLLASNVLVLQAPNQAAEGTAAPTSGTYVLRVPSNEVAKVAYAAQNGTLWFALRPKAGAKPTTSAPATSSSFFGH